MLLLGRLLHALPLTWALAIGRLFGLVWFYLLPIRRGVALANVRRVFGATLDRRAQRRIVRSAMVNLTTMGVELLQLPWMTRDEAEWRVRREGFEHLEAGLARGKGVITVCPHFGSFASVVASEALRGLKMNAIIKEVQWGPAQRFWTEVRRHTGIVDIPPRRSSEQILAALRRNEIVVIMIDQHMPHYRGIVTELCGQLASTTTAPARFALETDAFIVPGIALRTGEPGRHILRAEPGFEVDRRFATPEANVRATIERINRVFEHWLREAPEQWLWLHKRWKVPEHPEGWKIPDELRH
ncbi:MAG: lysophospholipid acyltransferase family protein, partial [Myxococcota bacterium]